MTSAFFRALARDASERYPAHDRFARHFAYGKLTRDPVFEHLLAHGLIATDTPLLDVGCGQGLVAALLDAAHERHARGDWPAAWPAPARPSAVRGIDLLQHDIERARAAVPRGEWIQGDIRTTPFGAAGTVIILDVLHYIGRAEQDAVLERVRGALPAGGRALVRVADASRTLRLRITVALDQLMCVVRRQPLARLHTRPLTEWMATMDRLGLRARPVPMSQGTPFANVLLVADAA